MVRFRVRFVQMAGVALAIALSTSRTTQAFYWVDWPGSGVQTSSSGTSQTSTQAVTTTDPGDPGTSGTVTVTGDPGSSSSFVPEPASLIVGLIGLGSVGLLRRLRRK